MKSSLKHATLRQLQIFIVAAEEESYGSAAHILHLTQPAVSMQMSKLSELLDMELFEKSGRKLKLTETGKVLLPYARTVMKTLHDAGDEMDAIKGIQNNSLNIGMVTTARYFMPRMITEFQQLHPEIDISVSIANREKVITALESGQIDVAIMGRPPSRIPTVLHNFAEHPYAIIASPSHQFAKRKRLKPQDLTGDVFIAREEGSGTRMLMDHYFKKNRLKAPTIQVFSSNESIKQAVMANMGLALISMHTIGLELKTENVVVLKVQGLPVKRAWYAIHLEKQLLRGAVGVFTRFVEGKGAGVVEGYLG